MYQDLKLLLEAKASPERSKIILDAAHTLDDAGLENHRVELQQLVYDHDDIEPFEVMDRVDSILLSGLLSCINNFSVYAEGLDVAKTSAILSGILLLSTYDDTETVLSICESDDNPEVQLADLLELVTVYTSQDFIEEINQVSPRLIQRLIRIMNQQSSYEETGSDNESIKKPIRERLRTFTNGSNYIINEKIDEGLPLAQKSDLLVERYIDEIEGLRPDRVAEEMVGILLASDLEKDAVKDRASHYFEHYFSDANFIFEANVALKDVELEPVHE